MKKVLILAIVITTLSSSSFAQEAGWPRLKTSSAGKLVFYQPQFAEWKNHTELDFSMAFQLTPAGSKSVVGVANIKARTAANVDDHSVRLSNFLITGTHFPSLDSSTAASMGDVLKTFLPPEFTTTISLDRLIATVTKPETAPTVAVRNDVPRIFVSNRSAILVQIDGKPVMVDIPNTSLQFVVNTNWPLFLDKSLSNYYLFTGKQWLTGKNLEAAWFITTTLPNDMSTLGFSG